MRDKVRPIYSELQGILSQAPDNKGHSLSKSDSELWDRFNSLVDMLADTTKDESFKDFKITPQSQTWENGHNHVYVTVQTYRTKISSLISRLHGSYFSDEQAPFSGQPGLAITNNNRQEVNVAVTIQLGIDLQKAMDSAKTQEEKGFIEAVMEKAATVRSYIEFLVLVLNLANQFGITPERVLALFKH